MHQLLANEVIMVRRLRKSERLSRSDRRLDLRHRYLRVC
jgi:hypothetical protein